jgi:hypothetical protein
MMPDGAGQYGYSDVYTSGTHVRKIERDLRDIVQTVDVPRFGIRELSSLRELAYSVWAGGTDLPSVLWQNGLLGYESQTGRTTFYSLGHADEFQLPEDVSSFRFHPCLLASVGR